MATIFLDADDTLWENNIRFERVVSDYLDWVDHPTLDRVRVREILNDIERANSEVHGYGSAVFLRSLHNCFAQLMQRPVTELETAQLQALSASLRDHTVELMPGVSDVLEYLGERHELRVLSKGRSRTNTPSSTRRACCRCSTRCISCRRRTGTPTCG